MARPLRIEFSGAVYHVTARGDRREPIFVDDQDRHALLEVVAHWNRGFKPCLLPVKPKRERIELICVFSC